MRQAQPAIEVHDDVLYGPIHDYTWNDDPLWGIYGRDGTLVDAAAYYRGPGKAHIGQSLRLDLPPDPDDAGDETFLYGGLLIEHFGHFTLSSISRFWPFAHPALKGDVQSLRILCHGTFGPEKWWSFPYIREPLLALGITQDRLHRFDRPTRIRRLIVPRPAFEEHNFIHTEYRHLMRTIGSTLLPDPPPPRTGPAYLSRARYPWITQGWVDEADLASRLSALGIPVIHPEDLTLAEQVQVFNTHEVVIGAIGSAFHAAAYAAQPGTLLLLSPSPVVNPNFAMLDQVLGLRSHYVAVDSKLIQIGAPGRIHTRFRINDLPGFTRDLLHLVQQQCNSAA